MADPTTVVRCPFCGHPYPMSDMQREVYRGRHMGCMNCGRPFRVDAVSSPPDVGEAAPPSEATPGPAISLASPTTADGRWPNPVASASLAAGLFFLGFLAVAAVVGFNSIGRGTDTAGGSVATYVIVSLAAVSGVAAFVCGGIGYSRSRRPLTAGRSAAVGGMMLGGVGFLVGGCVLSVLVPALGRSAAETNRSLCYSRLQQIGYALNIYVSATPDGRYPPSLDALVRAGTTNPENLICPAGPAPAVSPRRPTTAPATSPTSFVYVGQPLTSRTATADTVVAYEPPGNHADGSHVLFGDGTVGMANPQQAAELVAELTGGQNPPPIAANIRRK